MHMLTTSIVYSFQAASTVLQVTAAASPASDGFGFYLSVGGMML